MRNRIPVAALAALAIVGAFAVPASAAVNLAGETVAVEYRFPDTASVYPAATPSSPVFVIGAGTESTVNVEGVTFIDVDFGAATLDLVFNTVLTSPTWNMVPFNGLVFTGPGLAQITGWTVNPTTSFGGGGFDASRVTRVGNELRLNWNGLTYHDGEVINLSFTGAGVPEPATWAFMILGLGLVGVAYRHQAAAV